MTLMRTLSVLLVLGLFSCGETTDPVSISFAALVNGAEFVCGQSYPGVGDGGEWTARDARFYVHDVELVDAAGNITPVTLDADGMWQDGEVALLDFEDGCGDMGNTDLNTTIRGTAPEGDYTGVRFRVGVPESLNHSNAATAGAPLNLTAMFWNWNGGYKFMRIEGPSGVFEAWRLHLGSTMCDGDMAGNATCMTANRPLIDLDGADPRSASIGFDIGALFAESPLTNTEETPPGCMSAPTDMDCAPIFENLGLDFAGQGPAEQNVFSFR